MSRLEALEHLRDLLAVRLAEDDGKQTAALARQYRDTLREVDDLKRGRPKGSIVDELGERRRKVGKPDAAGAGAPAGRRKNVRS